MGSRLLSTFIMASFIMAILTAAGCGAYNPGGGSGGGGTTNPGQAQGFYECVLQETGTTMEALILPDDTFFGMFGTLTSNSFTVTGMATGQGTSGDLTYSGTFTHFPVSGSSSTDVLAATDVPQTSMSGTIAETVKIGFGGAALPASLYDYGTAASQSAIAGTWAGTLLQTNTVTINITSAGGVSSPAGSGCSISSGTVIADTKKGFYDVTLTFGPSPCPTALAGTTATGKGVFYLLPDQATHELLLAVTVGTTAAPTAGTVFFAHQ